MTKGTPRDKARVAIALLLACAMALGGVPVPALAEAAEEAYTQAPEATVVTDGAAREAESDEGDSSVGELDVQSSPEPDIHVAEVPAPRAGLVYDGGPQRGVEEGEGYELSGDLEATDAGDYVAIATPADGYTWPDGTTGPREVAWSIARKAVTVTADDKSKVEGEVDPELTATVEGTIGDDAVSYALTRVEGEQPGGHAITLSGEVEQGNYSITYVPGTLKIEASRTDETDLPTSEDETPPDSIPANGADEEDADLLPQSSSTILEYTMADRQRFTAGVRGNLVFSYFCSYRTIRYSITIRTKGGQEVASFEKELSQSKDTTHMVRVPWRPSEYILPGDYTVCVNLSYYKDTGTINDIYSGWKSSSYYARSYTVVVDSSRQSPIKGGDSKRFETIDSGKRLELDLSVPRVGMGLILPSFKERGTSYSNEAITLSLVDPSGKQLTTKTFGRNNVGEYLGPYVLGAGTWRLIVRANVHLSELSLRYTLATIDNGKIGVQGIGFEIDQEPNNDSSTAVPIVGDMVVSGSMLEVESNTFEDSDFYAIDMASASRLALDFVKADVPMRVRLISSDVVVSEQDVLESGTTIDFGILEPGKYHVELSYHATAQDDESLLSPNVTYVFRVDAGKSIAGSDTSVSYISRQQYAGYALTPKPVVTMDGVALREGADYTLAYANNVSVGTATVTITGVGNYRGTRSATFLIDPAAITSVSLSQASHVYDGRAKTPAVTVRAGGATVPASGCTVAYAKNVNAGTATVTVTGKGNYAGTKRATFAIAKAANGLTAKGKTATLKASKLRRKAQSIKAKKAYTVKGAQGKVTYTLSGVTKKKFKRYFKVNAKTGKVTVRKGLGKGTYKVKVKVTAAGDANHNAGSKTATVTVTVK